MICDVCGREMSEYYDVELEGSRMKVCKACSKYGKIIEQWKPEKPKPSFKPRSFNRAPRPQPQEDVLTSGYGEIIKKAREKRKLTREELGLMINERESILRRIEHESMRPDEKVLAKIEDALKLKLKVKPADVIKTETHETNSLTLGDIMRLKKK